MVNARLAEKSEILEYLQYSGFDITEDDIPDVLMWMIRDDLESWLEDEPILFDEIEDLPDKRQYGYIWAASLSLSLEWLAMRGQVQFASGDVQRIVSGRVETMFQRWQPMFFFAKGMARGFYELLPHDTYRTKFFQLMKRWKKWRFKKQVKEVPRGTAYAIADQEGTTTKLPEL